MKDCRAIWGTRQAGLMRETFDTSKSLPSITTTPLSALTSLSGLIRGSVMFFSAPHCEDIHIDGPISGSSALTWFTNPPLAIIAEKGKSSKVKATAYLSRCSLAYCRDERRKSGKRELRPVCYEY